jgi:hypothetical protein
MYKYKFFKIVYENTIHKDTIFVSENIWINIKIYLFAISYFHKLENKLNPNRPLFCFDRLSLSSIVWY